MSNGIVSTFTKREFTGANFFFHKSKTSYDKEVAKNFALQSQHLGHGLKIGLENEKRFQKKRKRRQELHCVKVTSCQSPIRMFQDEIQDETKGKWFSVINFFLEYFFNLFVKRKILLPCLGSKAPAQGNRPLRSETPQPLPGL